MLYLSVISTFLFNPPFRIFHNLNLLLQLCLYCFLLCASVIYSSFSSSNMFSPASEPLHMLCLLLETPFLPLQPAESYTFFCCCCSVPSHVWLFATPWTTSCQASSSLSIIHSFGVSLSFTNSLSITHLFWWVFSELHFRLDSPTLCCHNSCISFLELL